MMLFALSIVFCFWIVLIVLSAFVTNDTNKFYSWLLAVLLVSLAVGCWLAVIHAHVVR
jgi:lipopolysaccharide export LptBFGC system permease protein LptF